MTQKQIDLTKYYEFKQNTSSSIGTQTGDQDLLFIHLDKKKTARVYYSLAYKSNVLSFNFGSSKSFIFTKPMWKSFRNYINTVDKILNND